MPKPVSDTSPKPARAPRAACRWTLVGGKAHEQHAGLVLDLSDPAGGLQGRDGNRLLGLDVGSERPPLDAWVRGDDVTVTWEPADDRGLRATGLWRSHASTDAPPAWELVASATTHLLSADATVAVTSDVPAEEVLSASWRIGQPPAFERRSSPQQGLLLVRSGGDTSVLVMVHPSDHQAMTVTLSDTRAHVACLLFPTGVEKGVLLRSRVMAAVGPKADDLTWAARLAERFAASPAMLST
jgi:hypothetical protein